MFVCVCVHLNSVLSYFRCVVSQNALFLCVWDIASRVLKAAGAAFEVCDFPDDEKSLDNYGNDAIDILIERLGSRIVGGRSYDAYV